VYLENNADKIHYFQDIEDGYPAGSGGMESANKFICHTRMKRSERLVGYGRPETTCCGFGARSTTEPSTACSSTTWPRLFLARAGENPEGFRTNSECSRLAFHAFPQKP